MKSLILAAAFVAAPVAAAQPAAPASVAADDVDPDRLALATVTVSRILPEGSYARMMDSSMDEMMDGMYQSMFDLNAGDMLKGSGRKEIDPKVAKLSFRELMEKCDPHFAERLSITHRVTWDELRPVIISMEPDVREALARAYAKKLTAEQLADTNRFFETESGRVYAAESFALWVDPEITATLAALTPRIVEAMPAIMEKVAEATAHLPRPPDQEEMQERIAKLDLD